MNNLQHIGNRDKQENQKIFSDLRHTEWLKNSFTHEFIKQLETQRLTILQQAEDSATGLVSDAAHYRNKLIQAKTIRQIIDYVRTNSTPFVS